MIELNVKYPATQAKPEATPGTVIHSYIDVTPHQGEKVHHRYIAATTEEEKDAILREMPRATVTFHQLPEGEPFFDTADDRPRDKNGFAEWDSVWIKDPAGLGTIEAVHDNGEQYDVESGEGKVSRLKPDQIKHLCDMTEQEGVILERLAAEERAAGRVP